MFDNGPPYLAEILDPEIDDDMDISDEDEENKEEMRKRALHDQFVSRAIHQLSTDLIKNIEKDVLRVRYFFCKSLLFFKFVFSSYVSNRCLLVMTRGGRSKN